MKFEEIDLSELPQSYIFSQLVDKEFYQWELYAPTTIEADVPFNRDWWKYVYWIPKIKKDFYLMAIKALDFETEFESKCLALGIDKVWFDKHYRHFKKRLCWMRENGSNHIGEIDNG